MRTAIVGEGGPVMLGPEAVRVGYRAGAVVRVSLLSTGSLLLSLDDDPPTPEGLTRPLTQAGPTRGQSAPGRRKEDA
jgi:hypothetical protein